MKSNKLTSIAIALSMASAFALAPLPAMADTATDAQSQSANGCGNGATSICKAGASGDVATSDDATTNDPAAE